MAIYFDNLKPSSIAQSQLFSSKKRNPLSQNSIDGINRHFRKNKINYLEISKSFAMLEK